MRIRVSVVFASLVVACVGAPFFTACVGDDPAINGGTQDDAATATDSPSGSLDSGADGALVAPTDGFALAPASGVTLRPGKAATVAVNVARGPAFSGDVVVTLAGAPAGVTADPLTIHDAETSGVLTLHATATAAAGVTKATLNGDGGGKKASGALTITTTPGPGGIDTTFGTSGTTDFFGTNGFIAAQMLVLKDDKIVLGGTLTVGAVQYFALVRLTASGSLDATFGTNGVSATTAVGDLRGIALQGTKIVAVGSVSQSSSNALQVVRFNEDGKTLDTTFGSSANGIAPTIQIFGAPSIGTLGTGIAVQSDSKIVVCGNQDGYDGQSSGIVARYTAEGAIDTTFATGTQNRLSLSVANGTGSSTGPNLHSIAVQSTGVIVVGGYAAFDSGPSTFYYRLVTSTGLESNSLVQGNLPSPSGIGQLVLGPTGNIYGAGTTLDASAYKIGVNALESTGPNSSSFGTNGSVKTAFTTSDGAMGIALQKDGQVLVAGYTNNTGVAVQKSAFMRYSATGVLDATFGTAGKVQPFATSTEGVLIGVQSDGRIIAVARSLTSMRHAYVTRLWD